MQGRKTGIKIILTNGEQSKLESLQRSTIMPAGLVKRFCPIDFMSKDDLCIKKKINSQKNGIKMHIPLSGQKISNKNYAA